ncbi:MAG TPA: hypothetical protein PKW21_14600 [Rhabdaerophilum sp.]|nr:hypothetical protein [Rhabdaerophilum sp.]
MTDAGEGVKILQLPEGNGEHRRGADQIGDGSLQGVEAFDEVKNIAIKTAFSLA